MMSITLDCTTIHRDRTFSITRVPAPESLMLDEQPHSAHEATHGRNHQNPASDELNVLKNSTETLQSVNIDAYMLHETSHTVTR